MKLLALVTLLFSLSVQAGWNEAECTGNIGTLSVRFDVEMPFPRNSSFRRALLVVHENGQETSYDYYVTVRRLGPQQLVYSGAGLSLNIDIWPDNRPRWGWDYRSLLRSTQFNVPLNVSCSFPNAQ